MTTGALGTPLSKLGNVELGVAPFKPLACGISGSANLSIQAGRVLHLSIGCLGVSSSTEAINAVRAFGLMIKGSVSITDIPTLNLAEWETITIRAIDMSINCEAWTG